MARPSKNKKHNRPGTKHKTHPIVQSYLSPAAQTPSSSPGLKTELDLRLKAIEVAREEMRLREEMYLHEREEKALARLSAGEEARDRRLMRALEQGNWQQVEHNVTHHDIVEGDMLLLMANPPAMLNPYHPNNIAASSAEAKRLKQEDQRLVFPEQSANNLDQPLALEERPEDET